MTPAESAIPSETSVKGALALIACLLWGFAEATLFFVIPDVLLTLIALKSRRRALWGCAAATLGALAGGYLMVAWSASDRMAAIAAVDRVPFVPTTMVESVQDDLRLRGVAAVLIGPWTGKPYKLYAVQAPAVGIGLGAFLAISVPARILRFIVLSLVASAAARFAVPRWGWRATLAIWCIAWAGNYAVYWSLMSP